jgi:hypothetical protein
VRDGSFCNFRMWHLFYPVPTIPYLRSLLFSLSVAGESYAFVCLPLRRIGPPEQSLRRTASCASARDPLACVATTTGVLLCEMSRRLRRMHPLGRYKYS